MKKLFLVRHAKSSWDNPSWTDFERPLNRRGQHNAPFMAEKFASENHAIDALVSSPATRAIETAKYFASALKMEESSICLEKSIYDASISDLLVVINALPESLGSVMMFGHNPGFSHLAYYLTGQPIEMPTCSIVHIEIAQEKWQHIVADSGLLIHFDYPKKYIS